VKVDPTTFAKLGSKPATKAAEVLDAWASNASSDVTKRQEVGASRASRTAS
jgi:hypothetical protein